jgi:hypothetical protein
MKILNSKTGKRFSNFHYLHHKNMKQKFFSSIIYTCSFAFVLNFSCSVKAQHPEFQSVSDEITTLMKSRQERIKQELSNLQNDEWAGEYWAQIGSIDGASFCWSPKSGFTVRSGNDFHRGIERVNYGSVNFTGNLLTLSPEYLEKDKHTFTIPTSFVPVKWDKQHWLIPSNELIPFLYTVNSGDFDELETYFVKSEDSKKSNNGLPDVPKEYRKYLNAKPIKAKVLSIKGDDDYFTSLSLTLNAGKAEGVVTDMKFYLIKVKNVIAWIKITDVQEHTSEARISSIGTSGEYNKELKPTVGWIFSSKMP